MIVGKVTMSYFTFFDLLFSIGLLLFFLFLMIVSVVFTHFILW